MYEMHESTVFFPKNLQLDYDSEGIFLQGFQINSPK